MIAGLWNKYFGKKAVRAVVHEDVAVEESAPLFHNVRVKTVPEDAPAFKRKYTAIVCGNIELEINIENGSFEWSEPREISGWLKQPNRGYVSFDPESIAEKVIIPEVVEATIAFTKHAQKLDAEYVKNLDRFVDEKGRTWVLLKNGE